MTLIHKFSKFYHFFLFSQLSRFTGGFEVTNALALGIDMHGSLIQKVLGVLGAHLVDVWHIADNFPAVVAVALGFDLGLCIAARFQLLLHDCQHSFFCFIQGLLKLLKRCDSFVDKILHESTPEGEKSYGKSAFNHSLVVSGTHSKHLSRWCQRVGND
jgi:hypothetical protein